MSVKKKPKMPAITGDEREQVRIRRKMGLPLQIDVHGRERVPTRTAESLRQFDEGKTGKQVIRLRTADPLNDLPLSPRQRNAGRQYRSDYETASQSGIKPASMGERVDTGTMPRDVPPAIWQACTALNSARVAMGHHEIVAVVDHVCGLRRSIREVAQRTGDPRPALAKLLTIGLDKLADTYFGPVKGKATR